MYQLYINTMSPYATKSSAMIGYSGLACEPKIQNIVTRFATLKRLTGKTMVPMLRRGEWAINDSSRIASYLLEQTDKPLLPKDAALAPICWILEEFADEWLSLWVLTSRWSNDADAKVTSLDIGREMTGGLPLLSRLAGNVAAGGIKSLVERAGGREENRVALERSRDRTLQALETLLDGTTSDGSTSEDTPQYLFESYPTLADFAFYGQLFQFANDLSGAETMRRYPGVCDYLERLDRMKLPHPSVNHREGPTRALGELAPLFAEFLGTYWRVLVANHRAYHGGEKSGKKRSQGVEVELLDGESFLLRPSSYLVRRLEFVLTQLDRAYSEREELFGGKGLEIEHALVQQVARLTEDAAGRELLREYPHIGRSSE